MKNQILKFGALFLIIYISFIALGYLLARGNFVNPLAAKFFVKDMIILSLFCLVAAEFWLERTKFLLFFGIIFLMILLPYTLKFFQGSSGIVSREVSANFAVFSFFAFILIVILNFIRFKFLRFLILLLILLSDIIFLSYFFITGAVLSDVAIISMLDTNFNEATDYIKINLNFKVILEISVFVLLLAFLTLKFRNFTLNKNKIVFKISLILVTIFYFLSQMNLNEMNFYKILYKMTLSHIQSVNSYKNNYESRINGISVDKNSTRSGLFVLVIGESQNKNHMSVYGYEKLTTPHLNELAKTKNALFFQNAFSNHTLTAQVISQFITSKNQYNNISLKDAVSIIELANLGGFETIYLSNQAKYGTFGSPLSALFFDAKQKIWSTKIGIIARIDNFYRPEAPYDEILLPKIDELKFGEKTLLIIHLMANHWIYEKRYPKNFEKFALKYDNAVLYNDFIVDKILKKLQKFPNFKALIYCSDHGEDMKFMHDPSKFSVSMIEIPFFIYFSDNFIMQNGDIFANLKANENSFFTNDLIFDMMSGILGLKSKIYEPRNDISNALYDYNKSRFKTMNATKNLIEILKF